MTTPELQPAPSKNRPFRRAILRGAALIMPPLLTIVFLLWAWNAIERYVLTPLENGARYVIVWSLWDVKEGIPPDTPPEAIQIEREGRQAPLTEMFPTPPPYEDLRKRVARRGGRLVSFTYQGREYLPVPGNSWIPENVAETVANNPGDKVLNTPKAYYERYVDMVYLKRRVTMPVFLLVFIFTLYFLGKFLAAGLGRILWNAGEAIIHRLPVVNMIYGSMKQITDFVFSERELEFTRVVAVEYPRKDVWALGFVTGEGFAEISDAVGEQVISVLVPTAPVPATGFTAMFRKSEVLDLNVTVDQAIQYLVSAGVVVPVAKAPAGASRERIAEKIARRVIAEKK